MAAAARRRATAAAATARTGGPGRRRPAPRRRPRPAGVIPCNLRRHAEALCILAKAQPKVVKQLVAGADRDLIETLSECAANVLSGNMPLDPQHKRRLAKHADALRALRRRQTGQRTKKALLMKGGFVGLLAGTVAPMLMKVLPSIVGGVAGLIRRRRQQRRRR